MIKVLFVCTAGGGSWVKILCFKGVKGGTDNFYNRFTTFKRCSDMIVYNHKNHFAI